MSQNLHFLKFWNGLFSRQQIDDMRYIFLFLFGMCFINTLQAQEVSNNKMFIFGSNGGIGASYTNKAFLLNLQGSLTLDYYLNNKWSVQFAPKYSWLLKWNEHYLTIPIHLRIKLSDKFSLYTGPAITFDIGYFQDLGISAGGYYHFSKRSSINLSVVTFTLYDYHIDYLYVPVGLNYTYTFLK